MLRSKLDQEEVYDIFKEAVEISKNFVIESLPCKLIGMNSDKMSRYIEYVADKLLIDLGYNKLYKKRNPFKFMELIGADVKSNFFEHRPTQYQNAHINNQDKGFDITDDF